MSGIAISAPDRHRPARPDPSLALIIDDEPAVRQVARRVLEPAVCAVAEATNAEEGLHILDFGEPAVDVVVTDLVMPGLDGWDLIEVLTRYRPELPIVAMSGTATVDRERLRREGLEFLAKPFAPDRLQAVVAAALHRARRMRADAREQREWAARAREENARIREDNLRRRERIDLVRAAWDIHRSAFDVVVVAASAGGVGALAVLVAGLPALLPAAIIVVQHRAAARDSLLRLILARHSRLPVKDVESGERVRPGVIYLALAHRHLTIAPDRTFRIWQGPPVEHVLCSATVLFRSAAEVYRRRVIAVVLTGAGRDAADGVMAIRRRGGVILAQDEASSVAFGMPQAAIATGAVSRVLPLIEIAPTLVALIGSAPQRERRHAAVAARGLGSRRYTDGVTTPMQRDPNQPKAGRGGRGAPTGDEERLPESGMGGASDSGAGGGHPASRADAAREGRSPDPLETPGDADIERRRGPDPSYAGPERRIGRR